MRSLLFLIVVLTSHPALADRFFVDVSGETGDLRDEGIALSELVRSNVLEMGHQLARQPKEADYLLAPRILKLGSAYIVSIEKRQDGVTLNSVKLKARSADQLDVVADKLTRAVIQDTPPQAEQYEEGQVRRGTERSDTRKLNYFAFGPGTTGNLNTSGMGYHFSGGYGWDAVDFLIRLKTDLTIKKGAIFLDGGIGAQYFPMAGDFSPFVGGEFGFGVARLNGGNLFTDDTIGGFVLGLNAGVQILRTSDINLEISARYAVMLKSNSIGKPHTFGARVGIYF